MRASIFLVTALAAAALAGPTGQRSTCALHCTNPENFHYETGTTYEYDYSVTTSTTLLGTNEDDNAQMKITSKAYIDVLSPCEYLLKLTNVNLEGSTHGAEFSEAVMEHPLRFSFQDGIVETICSEVTEPTWVLNFKRGVLSTFQNSMTNVNKGQVTETDISGLCTTEYDIVSEGDLVSVKRIKDLSSCTNRPDLMAYLMSSSYASDSPVQSLPILESSNQCLQKIQGGVLKEAQCQETHAFQPFSHQDAQGAVTEANTVMTFVSQTQSSAIHAEFQFKSGSLVFMEDHSPETEKKIDVVEKILNDIATASREEMTSEMPALFSHLVSSLKTFNYPELSDIYNKLEDPTVKKFLIDAIPLVGTAGAAGILRDMVMNQDISQEETDLWFTSLAFLKNLDSEILVAVAPLLEDAPSQKALLGTSAFVNNYCKVHPDCESNTGVLQVIRRIETQLGSSCRAINENEKTNILIALKALGNAGRWINANSILRRCYNEEENDMEIRVAALEAWRHTPCEYDRSHVQAAFQDETQDTEVRLAAYLALMSCPTQSVIDVIKERLTSEGVNQVGSFVWTHLTNLQESASPEKQWMRELISEELLQSKFSTEALKYSRNYESSFFMNELNVGATVESNVIFSRKSFLPRSAMLNLTLDLFGESINFFEVGGRIEGFEAYIERFFGPHGYFPEETVETVIKNMREQKTELEPTTLEGILDKATDEPEGSYYLRVFGNELHYHHFHGLENILATSGATNPLEFLMDLIRKGDVNYSKSYQLFDTKYSIPTVTGLPLSLSAKSTATLNIQVNGKFKAHSMKNIDIEGHFHPSVAVEVVGLMTVDAHVTTTGLKMTSNFHTSTFLDGKMKINNGRLIDVAFNTPKEKVEVLSYQTKFFYLENDNEQEKGEENPLVYKGCTKGRTGIALCGELIYPSMFPFSRPISTQLYFEKTDTQTSYIFHFENAKNEISILFDTPGSQNDHKIEMSIKKDKNALTFDIQTPFKNVHGSGEYTWHRNTKNMKMNMDIDRQQYGLDASLITNKSSGKLEPSIVITYPDGELMNLKGILQVSGTSGDFGLQMKTPVFETNVKSQFSYDKHTTLSFNTDVEYKVNNADKQTIQQSFSMMREVIDQSVTAALDFKLIPSEYSDKSIQFSFKTIIPTKYHIEQKYNLIYGPISWEAEQLWFYRTETEKRTVENKMSLKCDFYDIDYLYSLKLSSTNNGMQADMRLVTVPGKDFTMTAFISQNRDIEVNAAIATQLGESKTSFEVLYNKIASDHHKLQIITKMGDETCLLEGTLKNKSVRGNINTLINGLCKCSGFDIKSNLQISADYEKAEIDMITNVNGHDYTVKLKGTSSSILIDINVIKHILLNAYITLSEERTKLLINAEWDKDVDPSKAFVVDAELSPMGINLHLQFVEKEVLFSSKFIKNGAEVEAKWASDKRLFVTLTYHFGDMTSLAATLLTPFPGLEKQDLTFSLSLKEYDIDSRLVASWKNSEQVSLAVKANLQPGMLTNSMTSNIVFSSTLPDYERISLSLEHNMQGANIKNNIKYLWNEKEMKSNFEINPNDIGIEGHLNVISAFTEDLLISLKHKVFDKSLESSIIAQYGPETSTLTMIGHADLSNVHDVDLTLKLSTPFSILSTASTNINYSNDGSVLKLTVDGAMGDKKMMLNMDGSLIRGETTNIKGDLRVIAPFIHPLTVSMKHQYNTQIFTSELEMSRIWSNYGKLKLHMDGKMILKKDIKLNAILSSPENKASITFSHHIGTNNLESSIAILLNEERLEASVDGVLDFTSNSANLQASIVSTFNGLEDIKIKISSEKIGETQTSKFVFLNGDKSATIDHTITFTSQLNWENSFKLNGNYMVNNKQAHVGNTYTHEMDYTWNSEAVHWKIDFQKEQKGSLTEVDTQLSFDTTWTDEMKGEVYLKYDDMEYNPIIIIEYAPGRKIELTNVVKFHDDFFYLESTMTTPFWETLGYKLNIDYKPRSAVTLVLSKGDMKTTIDIGGRMEPGKLNGTFEIHSTYLSFPLSIEAAYDILAEEKYLNLAATYDRKYIIKSTLSGNKKAANWSLMTELPITAIKNVELHGKYNIMALPLSAEATLKLNSDEYKLNFQLDSNEFTTNFLYNENKGVLSSKWYYSPNKANIDIVFESPIDTIDNLSAHVMYDFTSARKVSIKFTKGTQQIHLNGSLENGTFLFNGTTPFNGWETLQGSFFLSNSAISAFVSRNDRKLELNGTMHLKTSKGKINLIIKTPYDNANEISADLVYSFQTPIKSIEFKSILGSKQILAKGTIDVTDVNAPEIILDIKSPFDSVNHLGGQVKWNFGNDTKTVVAKAYHNEQEYYWELEASSDNLFKGHAVAKVKSPIIGLTSLNIKGAYDFTSLPYNFAFTFEKEGEVQSFEGNINLENNALTATVSTPIPGWEKIALAGDYTFDGNHLTLNTKITKNSENYDFNCDIIFNSQKPKLSITLKTPGSDGPNIDFTFDSNVIDSNKKLFISLKMDDILYSLNLDGELNYKTGYLKVGSQSPIPAYHKLGLDATFDFTDEVKMASIDFKNEDQNCHIALSARVNENNIAIEVHTPIENFETLQINGDYTAVGGEHIIQASFMKEDQKYSAKANLLPQNLSASLTIVTPIEMLKTIELKGELTLLQAGFECVLHFSRGNELFELSTKANFIPTSSELILNIHTPVTGWRELKLNMHYDVTSEKKIAEFILQKDSTIQKIAFEGSYNLRNGYFKLETPVEGFEVLGAEYAMNLNDQYNHIISSLKIFKASTEWNFVAEGEYQANKISIQIQTPFKGFNKMAIEGDIKFDTMEGKGTLEFGVYKFTVNVKLAHNDIMFKVTTPFDELKTVSIDANYKWTDSNKEATMNFVYNENVYSLKGVLSLSRKTSGLVINANLPFQEFNDMTIKAKYDMDNNDELISFQMLTNAKHYGFKLGGYAEEKVALLTCEWSLPMSDFSDVKLTIKFDLTNEDKNLEISMEKDGNIKAISISGKLFGETMDFNLKTPFDRLKHFKMFGTLNRAKRSAEFRMMSDEAEASFAANLKSMSLEVKSPFEAAREIKWELTKTGEHAFKAEWRRNDNYITIDIETEERKRSFSVKVASEFQGWEFLALTGRLDQETLSGYLSGELNEDKISVSGEGVFGGKSNLHLNIQTPYDNYKSVELEMSFSVRKKVFKLEASSSSSDFHFILERNRNGEIVHHSIFPNPQQPTEITMNLGMYNGKVTITSRFEKLRNYYQEYHLILESTVKADHIIKWNDIEVFKMDATANRQDKQLDIEMHFRRPGHHTTFEVHRNGYESVHVLLKRDDREFRMDATGSGNLPSAGEIKIKVNNSFREVPREVEVDIMFDISSDRRTIKVGVTPSRGKLYKFDLQYSLDMAKKSGEFTLAIMTPDRRSYPWSNISGSLNLEDQDNAELTFHMGNIQYKAVGKLTLEESSLTLIPINPGPENIHIQWKFVKDGTMRNYFLKFGRESKYGMFKLEGDIVDHAHVDIKGGFKAGPFMPNEFLYTSKWNKGADGTVNAAGSFEYGDYHGENTITINLNRSRKSATFESSGTSNIPGYERVALTGNYDFNKKVVIHIEVNANNRISKVEVNFSDLNLRHSRNTVHVNIPILEQYGQVEISLSHDFREATAKSLSAIAKFPNREAYLKVNWSRTPGFDKLESSIDLKSVFIGEVHIKTDFDISDISNAHADVNYTRTTLGGETKTAKAIWTRKRTSDHLETELIIDTPFNFLNHGRIYVNADFSKIFHLTSGVDFDEKHLTLELNIEKASVTIKITTPFENFELLEGSIVYNLSGKTKTLKMLFERGVRKVELDFTLNIKPKKEGDFDLKLTTPYTVVETLHIDGQWSKKKAEINYQRNDLLLSFKGKADIKADKSSFDISFSPPDRERIRIAGSYDIKSFKQTASDSDTKIASLDLEFDGHSIGFDIKGYRNSDRLYLDVSSRSSFVQIRTFHLKIDTQLTGIQGDSKFEIMVNDFDLKINYHFERQSDGYYFKSHIESSLTKLPGIIFGIGRKGEERIITIGYGEDKEITFSIKGKNMFQTGFSGYVDIPNFGYEGVSYEVTYGFENGNELHADLEVDLGGDGEVEAHFIYNSEGVEARFDSLRLGSHSMRVRRSVSSDGFFAEAGIDDYNLKLRGGFSSGDTKRGFLLEGEVLGKKFLIDALIQSEGVQYTEGKLIIQTPFYGWQNIGGRFTWSFVNKKIVFHVECMIPFLTHPKVTAEIDLNLDNVVDGYISLNIAGELFTLKSKLVGTLSEGYQGSIELNTPFHSFSNILINGSLKIVNRFSLEADFKVNMPLSTHEIKVHYTVSSNSIIVDSVLQSSQLSQLYSIGMKLEKTSNESGTLQFDINNNKIGIEFGLQNKQFTMNINSLVKGIQSNFLIEANYASLENMEGTLFVKISEETHKIHGNLNIASSRIQGGLELQSSIIDGQHKVTFDFTNPSSKEFSCDFEYVSKQTHSFHFNLKTTSSFHFSFRIDSPLFTKLDSSVDFGVGSAGLSVGTPTGLHKVYATWRKTKKMPGDWMANVEIQSPFLDTDYTAGFVLGGNQVKRILKAEFNAGSTKHLLEGYTSISEKKGKFSLHIETPFKNINRASIEASLNFESKMEMHVSCTFADKSHTFDLSFDKFNREFMSSFESPFVPTGMVKAEGQIVGELNKNMQIQINISDNTKSLSTIFSLEVISPQNIKTLLSITTPFKGYKKMKFNFQYTKTDVDTLIQFVTEKPVKFNAEIRFGNLLNNIKSEIKINTGFKGFERIEGNLLMPLNKFEPQVSADVIVDGNYYGGYLGLRTMAPYELAYKLHLADAFNSKFHLRTDSSFLSLLR